ncbi:MAG TPA: hypothetical protein VKV28_01755 [Candidatus Binataceae bacterium]|nr:hypothetical protein [Candidatus Binataceae bacterium]
MKIVTIIAVSAATLALLVTSPSVGRWGRGLEAAYAQSGSDADHPAPSAGGQRRPVRHTLAELGSPRTVYTMPAQFTKILATIPGGPIAPCSELSDPYPEFNGIALDPKAGIVVMSDTNLKSALIYSTDVKANPSDPDVTPYKAWVKGPDTFLSFAAGVAVDPVRHEFYTTENDVGDDVAAFPYSASGDYASRVLAVPHGSYGIAISQHYKQIAVAIQHNAEIIFYRVQAKGADRPLRSIRGPRTGLADPHGVVWDEPNREIFVSNYGNWNQGYWDPDYMGGGHYYPPSIRVFRDDDEGDATPVRVISGPKTQFNWPTGIAVDDSHGELFVANEAGNQVLVFPRNANGDVAPIRVLGGPHTAIRQPMGVAYDPVHDQIWVANFGHNAEVFDRTQEGDVEPRKIVRNAPEGSPAAGFGNPMALGYDSKRDQLLVPN